ncbi:MAG TPA: hydrogenase subunit MbhD domain-containing protein [Gammaproteobacteria bacterium]|nr:hydrogenase subunit MbhD domain-containing protein [Gammaproteobacteria bacterium]
MSQLFDLVMLLLLIFMALAVSRSKDLVAAAIIFPGYSLVMCLLWQHRGAPDVALTEAAVGAGVTTILVLLAIGRTCRREK